MELESQRGLVLDKVVLLGRTFEEYVRFFDLGTGSGSQESGVRGQGAGIRTQEAEDGTDSPTFQTGALTPVPCPLTPASCPLSPDPWAGREILDVAAGVSSFCAEANARGWRVTAFDRIYDWPPATIAAQCAADLQAVVRDIGAAGTYRWDFYQTPERMGEYRDRAWRTFLADYPAGRGVRYVAGELPRLPFPDGRFELSLVSYLLLVYEAQFSYEFHRDCINELMRVTSGEVRLYPAVTFEARRSAYLDRLRRDPEMSAYEFREIGTDFEFLKGSNSYVSIRRNAGRED